MPRRSPLCEQRAGVSKIKPGLERYALIFAGAAAEINKKRQAAKRRERLARRAHGERSPHIADLRESTKRP